MAAVAISSANICPTGTEKSLWQPHNPGSLALGNCNIYEAAHCIQSQALSHLSGKIGACIHRGRTISNHSHIGTLSTLVGCIFCVVAATAGIIFFQLHKEKIAALCSAVLGAKAEQP